MKSQPRIWALIVALVLSMGLAACGTGSESVSPPTAAATDTAPPATAVVAPPTVSAAEHVERGLELAQEGKQDEAIGEFEAALQLEPEHPMAHANLGAAYGQQGKIDQAVAEIEKAINLDPTNARAHSNLCHLYDLQGKAEQAMAACEQALSLDPADSLAHTNLGVLYLNAQDYDQAISIFTQAIELDPNNVLAHNDLGHAYTQVGDLEAATAALQEALRIDPEYAEARLNLGIAYVRVGDFESAIAEYKEAIRIRPDYADPHLNLAIVYRTLGQIGASADEFEIFVQLDPDSPKKTLVEAEVASLRQQEAALSAEYRSSLANFRLLYPKEWTYIDDEPGTVVFSADLEAAATPFFAVITVPLTDLGQGTDLTAVTATQEFAASIAGDYGVDAQQLRAFPLAGQPALIGDWEPVIRNTQRVGKIAFLVYEGLGYVIANAAVPEQWPDVELTGLAMAGSMTMISPELTSEYLGDACDLRYPDDWVFEEKAALVTFTPLEGLAPHEAPYVALFAGEENIIQSFQVEGVFDESSVVDAFEQLLRARVDKPVNRTFGEQSAVVVGFDAVEQGVDYEGLLVLFFQSPEPLAVIGAAPAPRWSSFAGTFESMMSSITLPGTPGAGAGSAAADPLSVLQAVFDAAETQDFAALSGLCDPLGENDGDTALICAITPDHPDKDSFVAYFANAKIAGDAVVQGDQASVPFLFGPEGDQEETMVLVKRDGDWYLLDF